MPGGPRQIDVIPFGGRLVDRLNRLGATHRALLIAYDGKRSFQVFLPTGRAISPITKTNWEGTGVAPDIAAPADQALAVAKTLALKTLHAAETNPGAKAQLQRMIDEETAAAKK